MGTPTKRRKKNDEQPARNLDFFFSKQSQAVRQPKPGDCSGQETTATRLTDEELARQLQAEWEREDQQSTPSKQSRRDSTPATESSRRTVDGDSNVDGLAPVAEGSSVPFRDMPTQQHESHRGTLTSGNFLSLQATTIHDDSVSYTLPFDDSPLMFDPQKFVPQLRREWAAAGSVATYAILTHCFVLVSSTQSRIKIVDTLVNFLRTIIEADPTSLLPAVWLATNSISPPYIDIELGLGGSAISKALKSICGLDNNALKTLYNKYGDAGDVAFEAKKRQTFTLRKPKPLTIQGVFQTLRRIADAKGPGCQETKQRFVERLIQDTRGAEESRYIVRTLVQHLRIGAVKTTMLIALSRAFLLSRPPGSDFPIRAQSDLAKLTKQQLAEVYAHGEEIVKASFARRPNYNDLVPALLEGGISDTLLFSCGLSLHIPLRPMLGGITRDMGEMLTKLQGRDFTCEYKYDGQRAQVHCDKTGRVSIFSRHLEVMTEKYPDLVAMVPEIRGEGVDSFILEGEVVAVDRESGELRPFQVLANRARKDVIIQSVKIDVCLFAFDLMYLNGEELLDRPFRERRSLLRSLFIEIPCHFTWVTSLDATSLDSDAVSSFFKQATNIKCEGIMVKVLDSISDVNSLPKMDQSPSRMPTQDLDGESERVRLHPKGTKAASTLVPESKPGRRKALLATYEPDKRLDSWLKVKKDYDTLSDTIDLIPVAAWHGQGRKNAWWSPILLACRNEETGTLEVVTKCISGFSDAFYKANKEKYREGGPNTRSRPSFVEYAGEPDVWFEPQEVWEMLFADITLSPTYTAAIGLVSEERGLSLRFPRFLKVREDKSIDDASTNEFLAALYRKQQSRGPSTDAADDGFEE